MQCTVTDIMTRLLLSAYQETCLRRISEGLQLHRALLNAVSPRLENREQVDVLQAEIRDLVLQINKVSDLNKCL